ncbi:MAG: imidazole glycerol phosphate synthase subunit HisF [Myxococcota bacterium]|nr:imidazole glycerol phosphate synthase subunit HisF [Myxococcota bacterium]
MLAKRIIACLDVRDGRVVKGVRFESLRDAGDPVVAARRYDEQGADEIALLDITASLEGRATLHDVVRRTAEVLRVPLTVGGGVRDVADVVALLMAGADKVSVNSAALADPSLVERVAARWGRQVLVVAIDARRTAGLRNAIPRWEAFSHGGRRATGRDAVAWAREAAQRGAGEILLTSMDRDGTLEGYDLELLRAVVDAVDVPVIASGGAGGPEHVRAALVEGGADAALAASIFHDARHDVRSLKGWLLERGVHVRPVDAEAA